MNALRCLAVAGSLGWAGAAGLRAQEITVGEIAACAAAEAPEQLPQIQGKWRIRPPEEMRKAVGPDVVFLQLLVKPTGQFDYCPRGTNPVLNKSVGTPLKEMKLAPARSGGQPVESFVWLPLIFNPAGAATEARDGIPRVLAAAPCLAPHGLFNELRLGETAKVPLWATARLDAAGALRSVALEAPADARLQPLVEATLRQWRFAPARTNGQPVGADLRLPVVFFSEQVLQRPKLPSGGTGVPPKVTKRVAPEYPAEMRVSGIVGHVLLSFVVNPAGKVENPVVVESNGPAFNQPAIEALLGWKFEPARQNGKPVATMMRQSFVFELDGPQPTRTATTVEHPRRTGMPESLKVDVLPKPRNTVLPVYPYALLEKRVSGRAVAALLINANGNVVDVEVIEATASEFGFALAAAAEATEFEPALREGRATPTMLKQECAFAPFSQPGMPENDAEDLWNLERKHPEMIVSAASLDAPVQPLSRQPPRFPAVAPEATEGTAMVEILINRTGDVRLPRIVTATDPAFGYAAVQAVAAWKFTVPKKEGKPVITRAKVPFRFNSPPTEPAPPAAAQP